MVINNKNINLSSTTKVARSNFYELESFGIRYFYILFYCRSCFSLYFVGKIRKYLLNICQIQHSCISWWVSIHRFVLSHISIHRLSLRSQQQQKKCFHNSLGLCESKSNINSNSRSISALNISHNFNTQFIMHNSSIYSLMSSILIE